MAQHSFSQDAWTRARGRFVEDLTEAEKQIYYKSSLEMIYYDASIAQKRHEEASTSMHLMDKLQPLVSAIDQYAEALDVCVNAYPIALSPLWGSLRVVLHLAREFGKYFGKLLDMFERIGDVLPRFQAYERLFPNNERLVQLISIVYVDILRFCYDVKTVFRNGKRSFIINLKIFSRLVWKPFDRQFAGYMRKFRDHERTVEKQAKLSDMIESSDSRAMVLASRLQLEREKQDHERQAMLSKLCVVSCKGLHMKQRRMCHEGTGLWALQSSQYLRWKAKSGFQALCCYAGCGKSVLVSTIVEDLLGSEASTQDVLYYYCSYADALSLSTRQILGSLLKQLILRDVLSSAAQQELLTILGRDEGTDQEDRLARMIQSTILLRPFTFLVVDGLDECKDETWRYMINFLNQLTECEACDIRILVTCRDEGQTLSIIRHWPSIQLSEGAIGDDLRRFVSFSVRSSIDKGDLNIDDPFLEQEIVAVLVAKAHGMFLWVHFQLIELCTAIAPSQIWAALQGLPDGLGDTYERILTRISGSILHWKSATKIFHWLACARRPLKLEEMQEAVAFDSTDKAWDADKIPGRNSLLKICQGLVIQDHDDGIVRFAHYTVQQYLFIPNVAFDGMSGHSASRGRVYQSCLTMEQAQNDAADLCITYLSFGDFETAIIPHTHDTHFAHSGILGPGGPGAISGSLGLGKPIFNAIYRVMGGRTRPVALDIDYAKYLNLRPKSVSFLQEDKYALLGYILENWPWHSRMNLARPSSRYRDLIVTKTLPFEFRPWGPNRHFGPYGCSSCYVQVISGKQPKDLILTSMMHWAAAEGNVELLDLMSDLDILDESIGRSELFMHLLHERYSKETMILACRMGRTSVIDYLLYKHHELCWDSSLLVTAAAAGHAETLESLRRNHDEEFGSHIDALLFKAATNGHASVVRYLVKSAVDPEHQDDLTGMTPLQSAVLNGHDEVIRSMAKSGFDIDKRDSLGATALHYTAERGHLSMTTCLIECGASIETKDREDKTPVDLAILTGHASVTEYLLAQPLCRICFNELEFLDELHSTKVDWDCMTLRTQLWVAAFGHTESLKTVLDEGNTEDDDVVYDFGSGLSLIHVAARFGNVLAIRELLKRGASLNKRTEYLCAPLHFAALYGSAQMVEELLNRGANPNCNTIYGWNPLHFAAARKYYNGCLEVLIKRGIDLNARTNLEQGAETPLHMLASRGNLDGIKFLAQEGAELKMGNTSGETAYEIAERQHNMGVQMILLKAEAKLKDRPLLWHLKRFIDEETAKDSDNPAAWQRRFGLGTSESVSNDKFNHYDLVYARRLINDAKEEIETVLREARLRKLKLLVFALERVIGPGSAQLIPVPSVENRSRSSMIIQPPDSLSGD